MKSELSLAATRENQKKAAAANRKPKVPHTCEHCGKITLHPPSHAILGRGRFCSRPCRYAFMRCDAGANAGGGAWMKGATNPNYKDGTGYERAQRHQTAEVQQWRRRVFARDGYICQSCGLSPKKTNQLRAHHVKPWAAHPDLRFDLANGQTLCKDCHDAIHRTHPGSS